MSSVHGIQHCCCPMHWSSLIRLQVHEYPVSSICTVWTQLSRCCVTFPALKSCSRTRATPSNVRVSNGHVSSAVHATQHHFQSCRQELSQVQVHVKLMIVSGHLSDVPWLLTVRGHTSDTGWASILDS